MCCGWGREDGRQRPHEWFPLGNPQKVAHRGISQAVLATGHLASENRDSRKPSLFPRNIVESAGPRRDFGGKFVLLFKKLEVPFAIHPCRAEKVFDYENGNRSVLWDNQWPFDTGFGVNAMVTRLSAESESVFLEYLDEFLI